MIPYEELVYALDEANGKVAPRAAAKPQFVQEYQPQATEESSDFQISVGQDFAVNPSESLDDDFGDPMGDSLQDDFGEQELYDDLGDELGDEEPINAGGFDVVEEEPIDAGGFDVLEEQPFDMGAAFAEEQPIDYTENPDDAFYDDNPLGLPADLGSEDDDLPPPPPPPQ